MTNDDNIPTRSRTRIRTRSRTAPTGTAAGSAPEEKQDPPKNNDDWLPDLDPHKTAMGTPRKDPLSKVVKRRNATMAARTSPEGGFTEGRQSKSINAMRRKTMEAAPPLESGDPTDAEIEAAQAEGRQIDLARAFPYAQHPQTVQRGRPGEAATVRLRVPPGAPRSAPAASPAPGGQQPPYPPDGSDNDPRNRLAYIEENHPTYAMEYKLSLIHRLTLRGLPLDQIANMLGMTTTNVSFLRKRLVLRLREEARHADIFGIAGQTQAFYNEVRSIAMRLASDNKATTGEKMNALRVALSAEADKHRFFQASGFYENVQYVPEGNKEEDAGSQEADVLRRIAVELLSEDGGQTYQEEDPEDKDMEEVMFLSGTIGRSHK